MLPHISNLSNEIKENALLCFDVPIDFSASTNVFPLSSDPNQFCLLATSEYLNGKGFRAAYKTFGIHLSEVEFWLLFGLVVLQIDVRENNLILDQIFNDLWMAKDVQRVLEFYFLSIAKDREARKEVEKIQVTLSADEKHNLK